jgi:hypothetical protein
MAISIAAESDTQERVFAYLADSAKHPNVHRIDTHGASVFLEGGRALKIKRAVRFPFLDLFDARKAESCLRRRDQDQPPLRAANLSPRRPDHAKRRRIA